MIVLFLVYLLLGSTTHAAASFEADTAGRLNLQVTEPVNGDSPISKSYFEREVSITTNLDAISVLEVHPFHAKIGITNVPKDADHYIQMMPVESTMSKSVSLLGVADDYVRIDFPESNCMYTVRACSTVSGTAVCGSSLPVKSQSSYAGVTASKYESNYNYATVDLDTWPAGDKVFECFFKLPASYVYHYFHPFNTNTPTLQHHFMPRIGFLTSVKQKLMLVYGRPVGASSIQLGNSYADFGKTSTRVELYSNSASHGSVAIPTLESGKWHHFAARFTDTSKIAYINGVEYAIACTSGCNSEGATSLKTASGSNFGSDGSIAGTSSHSFIKQSVLAFARVYDTTMTDSEMKTLYKRSHESDLIREKYGSSMFVENMFGENDNLTYLYRPTFVTEKCSAF